MLVGRQDDLDAIRSAIGHAASGSPQLVVIEGDPGIGKRSLARAALAGAGGAQIVRVTCDRSETSVAYAALDQLLRAADLDPGPPEALGSTLPAARRLLNALNQLDETISPLCVLIEEAHLMDESSAEVLAIVARRLSAECLLVIATCEPASGGFADAAKGLSGGQVLRLDGLSFDDLVVLTRHRGLTVPERRLRHWLETTGGNPAYLTAILEGYSAAPAGQAENVPLPASLTEAASARIAVASPPARALLELLSVAENPMTVAQVSAAAASEGIEVSVPEAQEVGLLDTGQGGQLRTLRPASNILRHTARVLMPPARRRDMHRAVAGVVNGETRLVHLAASVEDTDPEVARLLVQGAEEALDGGRYRRACELLLRAADVTPDASIFENLVLRAGLVIAYAEDPGMTAEINPLVRRCQPSPLRTMLLGMEAFLAQDYANAEHQATTALEQAVRAGKDQTAIGAAVLAGSLRAHSTEPASALEAFDAARQATERLPDAPITRAYHVQRAWAEWMNGRFEAALEELEWLDRDPRPLPERTDTHFVRARIRFYQGNSSGAAEDVAAGLAVMDDLSIPTGVLRGLGELALLDWHAGRWETAQERARLVLDTGKDVRRNYGLVASRATLANIAAAQGSWSEAERHLAAAAKVPSELAAIQTRVHLASASAGLERARRNPAAMLAALDPLREAPFALAAARINNGWWRAFEVEALVALDRLTEAADAQERFREESGHQPTLALHGHPDWTGALLARARGEHDTALEISARSVAATAPPLVHALQMRDHASLLSGSGRHQEARRARERAESLLQRLGATAYLGSAADDPDQRADGLPAHLTSREREVARLAAEGWTNKEIAARLFVTAKTIEYHLGNVMAKLGLRSRRQLRPLLARSAAVQP
ncbi:helix-turn-helix transcriptional regulator [Nesterenkonia ebinurensis]|uniref:helix-turn-helix transcriptional regulator n=1 Tax=Nesterenkonia ebinurensis TaxID=2608252 RepID=UPI00123DA83B|nr:LuxR family transcriptional regulator [Nesterenkonia ebinurensis]